ncbi:MAG: RNA 2',3'-cyclic phosphodiesterase [Planctomycetales bacterium]|nr:RNA 2',3'-cyclic phosphodiesterase [Planctomycetales bacterium]
MASLRTFIAVPLPPEVKQAAQRLARDLAVDGGGINWVEPQQMHLTLKFLGSVRENETYEICRALAQATADWEAFDLVCGGAGAFPSIDRPRTLWIGTQAGTDEFSRLHSAIDEAMAGLGFKHDPPRFTPHLTIGRVKQPGPWLADLTKKLEENAEYDAGVAFVDEVVFYASDLSPQGPTYTRVGAAELK